MPVSVMMAELDEKMLLQFETQELEVKTDIYLLMPLFRRCMLSAKLLRYLGCQLNSTSHVKTTVDNSIR